MSSTSRIWTLGRRMRLTRFSLDQAKEAIVQPARRLGLEIDEHFVLHRLLPDPEEEALTQDGGLSELRDAEHTIELPALQIVCEAW